MHPSSRLLISKCCILDVRPAILASADRPASASRFFLLPWWGSIASVAARSPSCSVLPAPQRQFCPSSRLLVNTSTCSKSIFRGKSSSWVVRLLPARRRPFCNIHQGHCPRAAALLIRLQFYLRSIRENTHAGYIRPPAVPNSGYRPPLLPMIEWSSSFPR